MYGVVCNQSLRQVDMNDFKVASSGGNYIRVLLADNQKSRLQHTQVHTIEH